MRPPTGGAESCTLSFVAFLALFFRIYDPLLKAASGPGIPACHVTPPLCCQQKSSCREAPRGGVFDTSSFWKMLHLLFLEVISAAAAIYHEMRGSGLRVNTKEEADFFPIKLIRIAL